MSSGTMSGAALSLGAAGVWGGGDFAGGIAAKRASVFRVVAVAHAFGLVLMLLLVWISGERVPPLSSFGWGVIAGITDAFGVAALYKGLSTGRMGVVAPVASVITAVLPVLFGIGIEGMPGRIQLLGFALAVVSIWLITLLLISGKEAGRHAVLWPLVSARAASTLLMFSIVAFSPRDGRPLRPVVVPILLSGVLDSLANAMFIAATRHGRLDVAAVLSSLYPASTVILARVLLKEKISRTQAVGIVGALIAVALISAR
jgi:drug/metabolite transporter (DMT)-like permease